MQDAPNESASSSGLMWCLDVLVKLVAVVSFCVVAVGAVVSFFSWCLTTPDGGFTCQYNRKASGVAGDTGETVLVYEVYNLGPGTLPNIHLEIDVEDGDYDEVTKKFSTGLVCRFLQATSGVIKTNGEVTSITAMPQTGGKCCMMSPEDTFSVLLVAPDENWWPKRVDICYYGGGVVDISKKPFSRRRLRLASISYGLVVLASIVFALAMISWAIISYRKTLDKAKLMTEAVKRLDWETLDQTQPRVDILPQIITVLKSD